MSSKHIINQASDVVHDALTGLSYFNPATTLTYDNSTISTSKNHSNRVKIISGGGSGHAPAHTGFVGDGMLHASVDGMVFASPNSAQVERALNRLLADDRGHEEGGGVLMVVKNYTGDVIQFGLARERSKFPSESIKMIVVGEDVALPRSQGKITGRRGLAATVLTYKIAGALAATGASLDEVETIAKIVATSSGSIGVGLEHCHVPNGEPVVKEEGEGYLKSNELEIGMGIHNEPGHSKAVIPTASKLVDELIETLTNTNDKERSYLDFKHDGKDSVILLVNNLGGFSPVELTIVAKEAMVALKKRNIIVERLLVGLYMSALNLPGVSLTLVLLPRSPVKTSFETLLVFDAKLVIDSLDAPTEAPSWPWHFKGRPVAHLEEKSVDSKDEASTKKSTITLAPVDPKQFINCIKLGVESVIAAEPDITHFDTIGGDGDAGLTLKSGGEGVLALLASNSISSTNVIDAVISIAGSVEESMGGTSGGLYAIFLNSLANHLELVAKDDGAKTAGVQVWSKALELSLKVLYTYTLARPPSRTLIDPLSAFISSLASSGSFDSALSAAKEATETTRKLDALVGRAAYVDQERLLNEGAPDAGAWGVQQILQGIQQGLSL